MRCFVALWPDEAARARLDLLAGALHARWPQARRMRGGNLHLTLAFIGELEEHAALPVAAELARLPAAPFNWTLDATGVFDGARVLWAGGAGEPRLQSLAAGVRARLDALGVGYDRKPFAPHVTLLRGLPRAAAGPLAHDIDPPITWSVERPVLLRSRPVNGATRYEEFPASGEG